jgi:adenosine deaminase
VSNVRTGIVRTLAEHPVRRYFDRGLAVSINTDDPWMFGTRLADEFRLLAEVHSFGREEIRSLLRQAVAASWLADGEKRALLGEMEAGAIGSETEPGGGGAARS